MTKDGPRNRRGGRLFTVLRRPFAAWIAALAILVQLTAGAAHTPQDASPAESAALALSAAIGQTVALCGEGAGGSAGAPHHGAPCCNDCTLCHAAGCAAALSVACVGWSAVPGDGVVALGERHYPRVTSVFQGANARSRAPPIPV